MRMSALNLLNLNVDTLFEQHNIAEIQIVHKKIQEVIENKREELRTMVGERYRDLLTAADTIVAMQDSSSTLIEQVDGIYNDCRSFSEQQLLGFKTATDSNVDTVYQKRNSNKHLSNYYSTMIQIKLLIALPELIWTKIDQEHFYAATELFIFSRHISTGLNLDINNALMQKLPVARKQWELLRPFHATIKKCVLTALERETLDASLMVECLLSLLLLEKSNLNHVVEIFLKLRTNAFQNCFQITIAGNGGKGRVKERILTSLTVLNHTVELLDKCLIGQRLLFKRIAALGDALPTVGHMEDSDRQLIHLLPDIIANFKPKFDTLVLDQAQLCNAFNSWLKDIEKIALEQLKVLFSLVINMPTIQEIKNEAYHNRKQYNFTQIEEYFGLQQNLNFYELKYVPIINARVHEIVLESWTTAISETYERIKACVSATKNSEQQGGIWQECTNDLPLSLAEALSDDLSHKMLSNRTKGYDATIIELCKEFDSKLAHIVNELNALLQEESTRASDKQALIDFLRQTAEQQLKQFMEHVKDLDLREHKALLFVVRICVALVELCPHLKICFSQQSSWRQWRTEFTANSIDYWQSLCSIFEAEIFDLWLQLIDNILAAHSVDSCFPEDISHDMVLEDFTTWQTITLEQSDELDNALQSTIRIPNQPRISLQAMLFGLIRTLNEIVPQTLPTKVLEAFNARLLNVLLQRYEVMATAERTQSCQNVALQLYFDLRFLQSIFPLTRADERELIENFNRLQNILRDCIDPFDFELFVEHIALNVKHSVARLSGALGILVATSKSSTTATQMQQTKVTAALLAHESDPNVLGLSSTGSTSLWFPLLPIVTNRANRSDSTADYASELSKATTPTPTTTTTTTATTSTATETPSRKGGAATRKSDTNKSKSSASMFFSMSQDWFR